MAIIYRMIIFFEGIEHSVHLSEQAALNDPTFYSAKEPVEYAKLLKSSRSLIFDKSLINKNRSPISQYIFEKIYHIDLYKLKIADTLPLKALIIENQKNEHITYGWPYNIIDSYNSYQISCRVFFRDTVSKIYLNLFGNRTHVIRKNDSLIDYYSLFRNFYIKYSPNGKQDFYGSIKDTLSSVTVPIEIMFLRRNTNLYIILMTPIHNNVKLIPGTLLKLINSDDSKRKYSYS